MIVVSARLAREHTTSELREMYVSVVNQLRPDMRVQSDGTIVDPRPRFIGNGRNYDGCRLKGFEGGGDYLMTCLRSKPNLTVEFWHDSESKPPRKTYRQFLAERIANIVNGAAKSGVVLELGRAPKPKPLHAEARPAPNVAKNATLPMKRLDAIEARLAAIEERLSSIDDTQGVLEGDLDDIRKHMRQASSALCMVRGGDRVTD